MVTFPYRKFSGVMRPVADVAVEANGEKIETGMLIDSGADVTMIPLALGRALGFQEDADEIKNLRGISGYGVPFITLEVQMTIGEQSFPAKIAWSLTEDAPLLLGRADVFDKFRITFDEAEGKVEFLENSG